MSDKKKKLIYFILVLSLAVAFLVLYLLDNKPSVKSQDDAVTMLYKSIKPTIESDFQKAATQKEPEGEVISHYEKVQIIDWNANELDSLQILSPRKDFSLIRHKESDWSLRSERMNKKIPKSNNAIFKVENVFNHLITNDYFTKNYSDLAKYFEYPACTVIAFFKDGTQSKLTFIRIVTEMKEQNGKAKMETWVRVNEETVVYKATYNVLARFLVREQEFLKNY